MHSTPQMFPSHHRAAVDGTAAAPITPVIQSAPTPPAALTRAPDPTAPRKPRMLGVVASRVSMWRWRNRATETTGSVYVGRHDQGHGQCRQPPRGVGQDDAEQDAGGRAAAVADHRDQGHRRARPHRARRSSDDGGVIGELGGPVVDTRHERGHQEQTARRAHSNDRHND